MTRRVAAVAFAGLAAGVVAGAATGLTHTNPPLPSPRAELAREAGVDPGSVRELFAIGTGEGRLRLTGAAAGGRLCLSSESVRGGSEFASAFRCVASRSAARRPLVAYGLHAETDEPALRISLVALVRPDVTRVVITTFAGRRIRLPVRAAPFGMRVTGYAAARPMNVLPPKRNDFARALTAYRGRTALMTIRVGPCCGTTAPTLSVAEQDRAIALARAHPEVVALLGDRVSRVVPDADGQLAGVWNTYGNQKIGALVELGWDGAIALETTRRTIDYDYTEVSVPTYREGFVRLRTNALTRLTVLVDLARNKVVGLEPGPRGGG